ncbi:MAG: Crp/Fnr family transcriptional regulator, partial [Desulfobulbaceae bacterium]|nr:Crp/Fnr family transcriptional regulator [Desulfobulbaceae bacterium]
MEFRNGIFIVTEEHSCPIYNVGEEFQVEELALSVSSGKPVCLKMVQELLQVSSDSPVLERFS